MENTSFKFKKWSFRLLIYTIATQIGLTYLIAFYNPISYDTSTFSRNLQILSAINIITLIIGVSFLIISLLNKEEKNYQIYTGMIIYPILVIHTLLSFFG